jgi:putative Mg2+ transporter-C (MgtC) family protein
VLGISGGQGLVQFGELGLAFVLSAVIGLEREFRQKAAGLRTHTLVGVAAALFMLISKYGFSDVLLPGRIVLDPSRVAAQIVSGIGFLGAGIIFVALYALPALIRRLPVVGSSASTLRLEYQDGRGVLRRAPEICTKQRFRVAQVSIVGNRLALGAVAPAEPGVVAVELELYGSSSVADLAARLTELDGVLAVRAGGTGWRYGLAVRAGGTGWRYGPAVRAGDGAVDE